MKSSRPTIRDVARLAGVSHQTVSRVINKNAGVTPETREIVEAAILELNYHPSAIARSMARGETRTLACISPNLTDYTFASIIEGAESEARSQGYFMLSSSAADPKSFGELVEELAGHRRVDGLIVINPYMDERYTHIPKNFPLVFVGAYSHDEKICSVSLDDVQVAYDATSYLLACGHKKVAMLTGPMEEDCSRDRSEGYRRALQENSLPVVDAFVFEGDWTATSGQKMIQALAHSGEMPSAIFAQNDRMAMGVLRAVRDLNLNVPDDIAVIGVDDMPLSSYFDPPLSTMRQDMPLIGQEAVRMMFNIIKKKKQPERHLKLPAELVVRQSTKVTDTL